MKQPHFFKGYSRIGLTNPPARQEEHNFGVELGSDAILTAQFLEKYPDSQVSEFAFTSPEDIPTEQYFPTLTHELVAFKNKINSQLPTLEQSSQASLTSSQLPVVVGGDNTVTLSSLLALLERIPDPSKIGYIQFDSHGESNSYHGSESKNFHGMYMRPFFDTFDIPEIDQLIPEKLKSNQAIFIGDMVLDGDEVEFFQKMQFKTLALQEYLANSESFQKYLKTFLENYDYIHVNFDIDVFDRSEAGATGIPEDGKWYKKEIFEILDLISTHSNISFDLSEINPTREGATQTIKLSQEILEKIIT